MTGGSAQPRQRGAALLIAVALILAVAGFGVIIAGSISGSDVIDSGSQGQAVEALFAAESGLERAVKQYAVGGTCASLGGVSNANITVVAGRTFTTTSFTTDFSGTSITTSNTRCRVQVVGTVTSSNTTRTIQAVIDRNLLGGANNYSFNNPTGNVAPSAWTLSPANGYAQDGGPDGTAPDCSRSAWLVKVADGNRTSWGSGSTTLSPNVTTTAGSTTTVYFDFHIRNRTGVGCATGSDTGTAGPCSTTGSFDSSICFRMVDSGNSDSLTHKADASTSVAVACADPGTPSTFSPCNINPGYVMRQSLTMTMVGGTATQFLFYLMLKRNGRKELFFDNLEAVNFTAIGAARVQEWRDCTTVTCP